MKITFAGPLISTFVKNDVTILRQQHDVDAIDVVLGKGKKAVVRLIALHLRIMSSLLKRDALFFWFADYYTLVPTIFARMIGKKVFVVAGGFDITYIPELGIGARTRPLRWFAVKNTFRFANHVFPVSQDTQNDLDQAVPNHAPSTMIYNAVDTEKYHFDPRPRKRIALTVSQADSIPEYYRKGIDLFIELAKEIPDIEFHVAGVRGPVADKAKQDSSGIPNVTVRPGRLPLDEILEEFWNASVYCQLSIEERFGVSVAEAMSCGCIPIISPVNALKEVVGDAGFIVNRTDTESIIGAIRLALESTDSFRQTVSKAAAKFDINERGKKLLSIVNSIGGKNGQSSNQSGN
jgi:glycosyltransferase involved in cell wall biosynthesis